MGGGGLVIPADVADPKVADQATERVEREPGPINVLVSVAMATAVAPVGDRTAEDVRRGTAVTLSAMCTA